MSITIQARAEIERIVCIGDTSGARTTESSSLVNEKGNEREQSSALVLRAHILSWLGTLASLGVCLIQLYILRVS